MVTEVNWLNVGRAVEFYKGLGYTYMEVPWIVSNPPYNATRPPEATAPYTTIGGNLVASGEQSFMELMLSRKLPEKAVCCTPCFRSEAEYDELHLPYFVKVELISTSPYPGFHAEVMAYDAAELFNQLYSMEVMFVEMPDCDIDLVGRHSGVELGSYGVREWNGFSWAYGTGLAEPRASQVQELELTTSIE